MPKYSYKCQNCEEEFEASHSIKEKLTDCPDCFEEGIIDSLTRLPSFISIKTTEVKPTRVKSGEMVKEYIDDNKNSLKEIKQKLKGRTWK